MSEKNNVKTQNVGKYNVKTPNVETQNVGKNNVKTQNVRKK